MNKIALQEIVRYAEAIINDPSSEWTVGRANTIKSFAQAMVDHIEANEEILKARKEG